jgi:hypothetical protein
VITVTRPAKVTIDRRIDDVRSLLDRTTGRLVELDADITRQLLESTSLRGRTKAMWADASRRHTELWRSLFALEAAVTRILDLRGKARVPSNDVVKRLDAMLEGDCVELGCTPADDARLGLKAGLTPAQYTTIEQALQGMSADYEVVVALVSQVAEVWGPATARLENLEQQLTQLRQTAETTGVRLPNGFRGTMLAIGGALAVAREDPLGLSADEIPNLEERLGRLDALVTDAVHEQQADRKDLEEAAAVVGRALEAVAACSDQVRGWAERLVVPASTWTALEQLTTDLRRLDAECEQSRVLGAAVNGRRLRRRASALLDEVQRLASAEGGRLRKRDELRGVLDAYRAKAQAVGLAENIELEALYEEARESLYVAPCDVDAAEHQVELYRRIIRLKVAPA